MFEIESDLCWRAEINIQVGLNMHLYVYIWDALSSFWGSTPIFYFYSFKNLKKESKISNFLKIHTKIKKFSLTK